MKRIPASWQPAIEFAGCVLLAILAGTAVITEHNVSAHRSMSAGWVGSIRDDIELTRKDIKALDAKLERISQRLGVPVDGR